jgi:hypothetical protein
MVTITLVAELFEDPFVDRRVHGSSDVLDSPSAAEPFGMFVSRKRDALKDISAIRASFVESG